MAHISLTKVIHSFKRMWENSIPTYVLIVPQGEQCTKNMWLFSWKNEEPRLKILEASAKKICWFV